MRTGTTRSRGCKGGSPRTIWALKVSRSFNPTEGSGHGAVAVGKVGSRTMHGAHVVQGNGARLADDRRGVGDVEPRRRGIHRAREIALIVMIVHGTLVRPGNHEHRTVLQRAVLDHDANFEDVVVGVRIERPILMPLHRLAAPRWFDVELAVVHA